MLKKLIALGVLFIMTLSCFSACDPKVEISKGAFYSLQEAYDNGWLTQGDVKDIAWYYYDGWSCDFEYLWENRYMTQEAVEKISHELNESGELVEYTPIPKNPETLDAETEKQIKQTRVNELRESGRKVKLKDVYILSYYGTYNGCVALMRAEKGSLFSCAEEVEKIADVLFWYGSSNHIKIWKKNN
ncbi:MAG: hypothetical protein FWD58_09850 [Firmicutes bacterium]|nr:hypothetical protein [Bacillota bacterium]